MPLRLFMSWAARSRSTLRWAVGKFFSSGVHSTNDFVTNLVRVRGHGGVGLWEFGFWACQAKRHLLERRWLCVHIRQLLARTKQALPYLWTEVGPRFEHQHSQSLKFHLAPLFSKLEEEFAISTSKSSLPPRIFTLACLAALCKWKMTSSTGSVTSLDWLALFTDLSQWLIWSTCSANWSTQREKSSCQESMTKSPRSLKLRRKSTSQSTSAP